MATSTKDLISIAEQFGAHNYHPLPVMLREGKGVWVTDVEGKRYLDMLSGYSALNFGHCHPRLVNAAAEQLKKLTLTCRAFYSEELSLFSRELAEFCGMEMVLPMNSGAEAVESAIKIARRWGYEKKGVAENSAEILCFGNNFHGRTTTIVGFSTSKTARKHFGPFTPGFQIIPFGDIGAVLNTISARTVAVLFEPIQAEAGILMPPPDFLQKLREVCTAKNVLLIADEIQTGLCRTGKRFACEHEAVKPDIYILGKSLGGGIVPISAVVGSREVLGVLDHGSHGSTFGGNPFACAIGREVMKLIVEEKVSERVAEIGAEFRARLQGFVGRVVSEVRGRGLLIGLDIRSDQGTARDLCEKLLELGVLCKDTRAQTLRIAPPLIIDRDDLEWAAERLAQVLT